jgi:hypothetical protein
MSVLTANTCDIITIYPMGVECLSVDASTPLTYDGFIQLIITGGTNPYSTTWSNGATTTNFLTSAQTGSYTAVTTDYYGDFTATTVCEIGVESYYVEKFTDCSNPLSSIYYIVDFENQVQTGKTYTILGQLGCWISEGVELYSSGTFYENFVTINTGPFINCTDCLPQTPQLESTSALCLSTNVTIVSLNGPQTTSNQYQFFSANTINGYPSFTSSTLTMYYSNIANKWLVSGWTEGGIVSLQSTLSPPIGIWDYSGQGFRNANVTQGLCGIYFNILTNQSNPTCINSLNGAIIVNSVQGGIPPYTYSLNNVNYQTTNIFNGLDDGSYTIYVKDIIGNISTKIVNLTPQQPITDYQVNLVFTPTNPTPTNTNISTEITLNYQVSVTPSLPPGKTLIFDLIHNTSMSAGTATNAVPELTFVNTTGSTGTVSLVSFNQNVNVVNYDPYTVSCHPNFTTTAITRTYGVQISGSGVINGTIYKKVKVANSNQCAVKGEIKDDISIVNLQITNINNCESFTTSSNSLTNTLQKTGTLLPNIEFGGFNLNLPTSWSLALGEFDSFERACSEPTFNSFTKWTTSSILQVNNTLYNTSAFSSPFTTSNVNKWIKLDKGGTGITVYAVRLNGSGQVTELINCSNNSLSSWEIGFGTFASDVTACADGTGAGYIWANTQTLTVGSVLYTNSSLQTPWVGTNPSQWLALNRGGLDNLVYAAKINLSGVITQIVTCV